MPSTRERLTLPSPAGTLWRRAQQVVHEELQQFGTPRLGGGTTLGARWGHRDSSDIDLTIEPEPGGRAVPVSAAIMTPGSQLLSRLEGLDIGTVKCEILTEAQFHVSFHDPDDESRIRFGLDIASVGATPRLGHGEALVEGSPAVVLTTAQILTGKLHRWGEATLRDAVDFGHAARRDRDSLTFAINTLSSIETEARKQKFKLAAAKLATTDDPVIRRMAPEHRPDQATLGQATADIVHGLRYAEVSITAQRGICHFEATTHNKHSIHLRCPGNQVDRMFATCGIDEYLHTTLKDPAKVQNEVRHACRRWWRRHAPIVQERHAAGPPRNEPGGSEDDAPGGRTRTQRNAADEQPLQLGASGPPKPPQFRPGGDPSVKPPPARPATKGLPKPSDRGPYRGGL